MTCSQGLSSWQAQVIPIPLSLHEKKKRWRTTLVKEDRRKGNDLTKAFLKKPHQKRARMKTCLPLVLSISKLRRFPPRKTHGVYFGTGCRLSIISSIITSCLHTCTTGKHSHHIPCTKEISRLKTAIRLVRDRRLCTVDNNPDKTRRTLATNNHRKTMALVYVYCQGRRYRGLFQANSLLHQVICLIFYSRNNCN